MMTPERWQRLSLLFEQAMERPAGERSQFLEQECADDAELRREAMGMIAAEAEAGARIETMLGPPVTELERSDAPAKGQMVGAYRLEEEVGRGGMGTVWRAERAGGFRQTVAVKLIKRGMDTDEVIRRFSQERQILSLLSHPNIARLLDGGATADGGPYLVMEYIEGKPLLAYSRNLPERKRLELFQTICAAVQHAHSHLVIHRDLKPANVLIRGEGEVKLLDFGIAKLLESGEHGETVTQMRMLTPAFASPEQREGKTLTTATDIYSLGRILGAMVEDARGDLRAIVEKATREEPEGRYATAEQLAEDVARYLRGHPVEARSGAFTYRAAKFLSRYALAVSGALVLLAATLGGLGYVAIQKRTVEMERDRAENVARFLRELFSAADPERNQGNRVSTRELLDLGAARIRSIQDGGTRLALLDTIGEAYFNLGLYEKASAVYRELLSSEESDRARRARALAMLAESEAYRGRHAEAEAAAAQALEAMNGTDGSTRAVVWKHRCNQLLQATKVAPAMTACQNAVTAAASSSLPPVQRSGIFISLGNALMDGSKFSEAEAAFQQALRTARGAASEPLNSGAAQALTSLGGLYFRQGRFADAEKTFRETIEFKRKLYPDGHLDLARSLNNLANTLVTVKRNEEAIPIYTEAHGLYRRFLGAESSELASSLSNLAIAYSTSGRLEEAERISADVVAMQARTIGVGKLPHASSQLKLAAIQLERGKPAEAVHVLEEALAAMGKMDPAPKIPMGYAKLLLAEGLLEQGKRERAAVLARESQGTLRSVLRSDHWMIQQSDIVLGGALVRNGDAAAGRKILAPIVELNESKKAKGWWMEVARRYVREAGKAKF